MPPPSLAELRSSWPAMYEAGTFKISTSLGMQRVVEAMAMDGDIVDFVDLLLHDAVAEMEMEGPLVQVAYPSFRSPRHFVCSPRCQVVFHEGVTHLVVATAMDS